MTAVTSTRGGVRPGVWKAAGKPRGAGALALDAFWVAPSYALVLVLLFALLLLAYGDEALAKLPAVLLLVGAFTVFTSLSELISSASDARAHGAIGREKADRPMSQFVLAIGAIGSMGTAFAKAVAIRLGLMKLDEADNLLEQLFGQVYRGVEPRWAYIVFLGVLLVTALAIALGVAARINPLGWTVLARHDSAADKATLVERIADRESQIGRARDEIARLGEAVAHHRRQADEAVAQAQGLFEASRDLSKAEEEQLQAGGIHADRAAALHLERLEVERRVEETARRVDALTGEAARLEADVAAEPALGRAAPPRRRACTLVNAARTILARDGETLAARALALSDAVAEACAQRDAGQATASATRLRREAIEDQIRAAEQSAREHEQAFARAAAAGQAAQADAAGVAADLEALRAELADLEADEPYQLKLSVDRSHMSLERRLPRGAYQVAGRSNYEGGWALMLGALALQPLNVLSIAPAADSVQAGGASVLYVLFVGAAMTLALYWHHRTVAKVARGVLDGVGAVHAPLIASVAGLVGAAVTGALLVVLWRMVPLPEVGGSGPAAPPSAEVAAWPFLALAAVVGLIPLIAGLRRRWRAPAALVLAIIAGLALWALFRAVPPPGYKPVKYPDPPEATAYLRPVTLLCHGTGEGTSGAWRYASADALEPGLAGCRLPTGDRSYVVVVGTASEEGADSSQRALAARRAQALGEAIQKHEVKGVRVLALNLGQRTPSATPPADPEKSAAQRSLFVLEGKVDPARKTGPLIDRRHLLDALKAAGLDPAFYETCDLSDLSGKSSPEGEGLCAGR